jgi:hypothetical protein
MEPQQAQATNAESSSSQQRRKRGAGVVTANACTECRKKRSKVSYLIGQLSKRTMPLRRSFSQREGD